MSEMSLLWMHAVICWDVELPWGESGAKTLEVLLPCPVFPWWVKGINEQTFNNIMVLIIVCIGIFLDGGTREQIFV